MWKFYKAVIISAVREFWTATDGMLAGTGVLFFFLLLANRKVGERIMTAWNGISPWWSMIPISLLVFYRLLRANYEQFARLERTRDDALAAVNKAEEKQKSTRDFAKEWDELAAQFKEISPLIHVDWQTGGVGFDEQGEPVETFRFSGIVNSDKCLSLCKRAGVLLLLSPKVVSKLPSRIRKRAISAFSMAQILNGKTKRHYQPK